MEMYDMEEEEEKTTLGDREKRATISFIKYINISRTLGAKVRGPKQAPESLPEKETNMIKTPRSLQKASLFLMPARLPSLIRLMVSAAISAAPTPDPSSAARMSTGSRTPAGQSRISRRAWAPRVLKCGYLLKTLPSAPTWQEAMFFFLQMAATPQAERRAARVPISSASRRQSSSSGLVATRPRARCRSSAVSERFSNGSDSMCERKEASRE